MNPERIPPPTPLGQIPMYQGGSHTTRCHHNPPGHMLRIPPCTVRRRCAHARLHLRRSHAPPPGPARRPNPAIHGLGRVEQAVRESAWGGRRGLETPFARAGSYFRALRSPFRLMVSHTAAAALAASLSPPLPSSTPSSPPSLPSSPPQLSSPPTRRPRLPVTVSMNALRGHRCPPTRSPMQAKSVPPSCDCTEKYSQML